MKRLALTAALMAVCASPARAIDTTNAYGAVMGTYVATDTRRDASYGIGGHVVFLGLPISRNLNLEVNGWGDSLKRRSGGRDYQGGGGLDLNIGLSDGKFATFLLLGTGAEYEHLATSARTSKTSPYLDAGFGVIGRLTQHLAARLDGRYYVDFNGDSYPSRDQLGDVHVNLGLQYSFGTVIPSTLPPPPPPPPPVLPPPAAPLDSDGDGVPDSIDQCPNTPAGVKVDAKGCPLDSDGDGVPDYLDKCPGTPKGFKVDASGCIVEQTVILRTVNFEFNKSTLTPAARDTLDQVAAGLAGQPSLNVEIAGHTDSIGSAAANLKLSKARAESVRSYLIAKGVDGRRLLAKGYGKTRPIADNKTEEGRAENRRVEFVVLTKPLDVKVVKKGSTSASKAEAQAGEPKHLKKRATKKPAGPAGQ